MLQDRASQPEIIIKDEDEDEENPFAGVNQDYRKLQRATRNREHMFMAEPDQSAIDERSHP
ncbi:hypothetical protein ONS95_002254 [Cadophora gregata]|uniref:uncharacterized protein n=1 Tax=Cadophora gregata TaxID=51156 RepID=UPI0026DB490D|nr:uncharacterized protein ONS95_002254 [Cadophora gregata]KAK0109568.1 hypothetical protein ONS95_002254 [Cadophora gregata]KAK0110803.1 hypothetical protein ONS96_002396 [Cadophora gregata f. sp. sojae]